MKTIQLKDAKATLSAVVDEAVEGSPSVITRHGRPEAVVVSYAEWRRLMDVPSFGRLLANVPFGDEDIPARDESPARPIEP